MSKLTQTVQSADWKNEKHAPAIEVEKSGNNVKIYAGVGKEIAHPNTFEHHISWIKVFVQPDGAKFPIEVGSYEFNAHGEEEVLSVPAVNVEIESAKGGKVYAMSYCNIHGLWESEAEFN